MHGVSGPGCLRMARLVALVERHLGGSVDDLFEVDTLAAAHAARCRDDHARPARPIDNGKAGYHGLSRGNIVGEAGSCAQNFARGACKESSKAKELLLITGSSCSATCSSCNYE